MEKQSSTSQVTVEYFDPHNVYKLLAPGLLPRLPLRNLNWPSHSGPVRSIDSLHVDLVEAVVTEPEVIDRKSGSAARDDGFQTQQVGGQRSTEDVSKPPAAKSTTRRHQIPGLRNTPYLKVLLVRCDDNDSYKTTVRSEVREWIKNYTPTSSSKKTSAQENHDASEWMIVHVVIPNTAAATQARSSGKVEGSGEKSTSRWRTGTTPLLEKLRSDFNSSSKGAPDRVAQIRIGINDVPYDILPRVVPAVPSGYSETDADAEAAWNELINKFKSLILSSFDMRVTQYEDDIKEKDGQRSLPGWNFCTFFILKEGLARGFESVGLVEDALVGYDELSVGLDSVIHEQAESGEPEKHGGAMLPYTEDVQKAAKHALAQLTGEDGDEAEDLQSKASKAQVDDIPIMSSKKAYRDMILANKVSVFDFRCYIFSRQISLLLRLGNASATREELLAKLKDQYDSVLHGVAPLVPPMNKDDGLENLGMLSEVCRRTLEFIPSVSQVLRKEVAACLDTDDSIEPLVIEAVDNLVSSFAFSVAQQVLAQTSTKALPIPPTIIAKGDGAEPKSSIPEPKTMMHPARMSSLPQSPSTPGVIPGPGRRTMTGEEAQTANFLKVGLEELAAQRAELYMLSRNVLERLGKKRGWSNGWDEVDVVGDLGEMEEIDLNDKPEGRKVSPSTAGIDSETLRTATDDEADFYRLYEILTDRALHHFAVANHEHAMQGCRADLAVLKVHMKEYKVATSYFEQVTQFFGCNGWSLLALSMLVMYAQCLGELESDSGYVRVAMTLITEFCGSERDRLRQTSRKPNVDLAPIRDVAKKLFAVAKELPSEVRVSLTSFVTDIRLEGFPQYTDDEDSCSLHISMTSLLPQEVTLEVAQLKITTDDGPCRDITFESINATLRPGHNTLSVKTNSVVPGTYRINRLTLSSGSIILQYDHGAHSEEFRHAEVTLFQRTNVLDVQLVTNKHVRLHSENGLDLRVKSGWNDIKSCEVRVRPTTGGLRLLIAKAELADDTTTFSKAPEAGALFLDTISPNSCATVQFPYSMEHDLGDVSVKIEATYITSTGETFYLAKSVTVPVSLAVGVQVQDVFKHNALFARFNVSTASTSPLRLYKTELQGCDLFESSSGAASSLPVTVFPKQPATLLYKVARKTGPPTPAAPLARTMSLKLEYSVLQQEVEALIQESLMRDLDSSFSNLVAAQVLAETKAGLQTYDLERAALTGYVTTAYLENVSWAPKFQGLGEAAALADHISSWQKAHPRLKLSSTGALSSILIPVEITSIFVVHTADMRIDKSALSQLQDTSVASVSQVIPTTLHLKWTRGWDTTSSKKQDEEFSYEVTAPSDAWLIGGRRKGHFVIPADSDVSSLETEAFIPLVLIPQKEGYLPYPSVEIKEVDGSAPCEVDWRNLGETVRVVSRREAVTVSLDASGPAGGPLVLEGR